MDAAVPVVPVAVAPNGTGKTSLLVRGLVTALVGSLAAQVLILACLLHWPPQDWNLAAKVLDHLAAMDLLVGGGLLNAMQPPR